MLKRLKNRIKEQQGFTLIELLAVIVILGILAAVAIPAIGSIIQNSRVDAAKADAVQILNAAKLYSTQETIGATQATGVTVSTLKTKELLESTPLWGDSAYVIQTGGKLQLTTDKKQVGSEYYKITGATIDALNIKDAFKSATDSSTPITKTSN